MLLEQGNKDEALEEANREPDAAHRLEALAIIHHGRGEAAESRRALDELIERFRTTDPLQIARVQAVYGDQDAAFEWLDRAVDSGGAMEATPSRHLAPLHSDPRWRDYLRKMGLDA